MKFASPIVNKIELSDEGDIKTYRDDCGYSYMKDGKSVFLAHQFRSNALIKRKLIDEGLRYELGLSPVGFREEAWFSLRTLMAGYKIVVDLQAVAWHAPCQSGGCRYPNYAVMVQSDEQVFRKWVKNHKDVLKGVLS